MAEWSESMWNLALEPLKTLYLHSHNAYGHKLDRVVTYRERLLPKNHIALWSPSLGRSRDKPKNITFTRLHKATKLGRMVAYLYGLLLIKSQDPLIKWSYEITWQTKTIISLLLQCLRLSSMAGWWFNLRLLPIKSHDPLIVWACKITWQTKTIISPVPQCLWLPNLTEWWHTMWSSH